MPRSLRVLPTDLGRSVSPTLLPVSVLGLVLGLVAALVLALGAVRPLGAQEVELPLDRYQALREAAYPEPEPDPEPPVPVAFESARLTLEVSEDRALVTQILELTLLDDRWRTLTLPAAGTVLEADLDGTEGFLEGEDGGAPELRLRGEGRHRIRLVSAVPVEEDETATRATRRLALPLPAAAAVSGTLTAGPGVEEIEEIEADNGAIFTRDGVAGSGTWRFLAEPGSELRATLLGPAAAPRRDGRPLRYDALSATAVQVTRTRLLLDAWIEARVLEGQLEALTIPLPAGWDLVRVEPSPPATWDLITEEDPMAAAGMAAEHAAEDSGRLRIEPVQPVSETLRVYLRLSGASRDLLDSPLLVPEGAARTRLLTKMHVTGDGLPSLLDAGSGSDAALASARVALPPGFAQAPGLLLRVGSAERPPRWQVIWSEGTEVLAAEVRRLLVDVLVGEEGRAFYQMWLETRSSGSPRLTLTPPPGFEVTVGGRDGVPLTPGAAGGALALPLSASQEVQVLYLAGFLPLTLPENGPFQVPLPQLSAPARKVEVRVLVPGDREVELADPTRGSGVESPPRKETPVPRTNLSNQVAGYLAVQTGVGDFLTSTPPGFREIEAVWSALSPDLAPLDLKIDDRRSRKEWF